MPFKEPTADMANNNRKRQLKPLDMSPTESEISARGAN